MYRGYIKLWRKIDDHPIAKRPNYLSVFLFIVRSANHKDKTIIFNNKNMVIKRGSFLTSADKIAAGTGVPRGTVERILKYLENEVMIEEQTTTKYRLISVINYQEYQQSEEVNEEQMRSQRGGSEEVVDTTNNDKNVNNEKNVSSGESGQPSKFEPTEDDVRLATLLRDLIRQRQPTFKDPNIESWSRDIEKTRRIDERTSKQIEWIIRWCQADNFWQGNILSARKLREKFDQLVAKAMSGIKKTKEDQEKKSLKIGSISNPQL